MSKDTIYREDAIDAINLRMRIPHDVVSAQYASMAINAIYSVPSADRPQGEWKAKSFHEFFCDNCGFSFDMMKCDFLENMKFCPNCGARKGAGDE